jgi:hypothetical protein
MTSWINTPTRKAEGIHVFLLDINGHKSRRGYHGLIKTGIVTVKARELEGAAMRCGPSDLNSWWDPSEVPTADSQRNNNTIPIVQLFLIRRWWCRGICVIEDVKGAKSLKNISSSINLWVLFFYFLAAGRKCEKSLPLMGEWHGPLDLNFFLLFNEVMGPIDPREVERKELVSDSLRGGGKWVPTFIRLLWPLYSPN